MCHLQTAVLLQAKKYDITRCRYYPFPLLVEQLQVQRDASRTPVFQVMFVLQTAHLEDQSNVASLILGEEGVKCDIGGAIVHSMEVDPGVSQFDLSCMVSESEGDKLSIVRQLLPPLCVRVDLIRLSRPTPGSLPLRSR